MPNWKLNQVLFQINQGYHESRPLELIHMDLFGPSKTKSLNRNCFVFVLVDNFSRFTLVFFLEHKDQAFRILMFLKEGLKKKKVFNFAHKK